MASPKPGPTGYTRAGNEGESTEWTTSHDLGGISEFSISPQHLNFTPNDDRYFQQQASFSNGNPSALNPQDLITQTAPPFLARKSSVSGHRQYHTDSRVLGRRFDSNNRFPPGLGASATEFSTVDPRYLIAPGQTSHNPQNGFLERAPNYQDFTPQSAETLGTMDFLSIKSPDTLGSILGPQVPTMGIKRRQSFPNPRSPEKRRRYHQNLYSGDPRQQIQLSQSTGMASSPHQIVGSEDIIPESATSVIENWLDNYPSIPVPSDAHFQAFSVLTGQNIEILKRWCGKKLRQGRMKRAQANVVPQTLDGQSTRDHSLPLDHASSPELPSQQVILRQAAAWVRDEKGTRCTAVQDYTRLHRDNSRPYQCTLKCSKTFARKDDWRKHEETNYPQEGWLCNVGAAAIQAGVLVCTFCSKQCPGENHLQEEHPRKIPCHGKSWNDRGRLSFRKDKFSQHFRNNHPNLDWNVYQEGSHFLVNSRFPQKCGFCSHQFFDWQDRINHIGDHFASHTEARDMTQWQDPHPEDAESDQDEDDSNNSSDDDSGRDLYVDNDQHGNRHERQNHDHDNKDDTTSDSSISGSDDNPSGCGSAQGIGLKITTKMSVQQDSDGTFPEVPLSDSPSHISQHAIEKVQEVPSYFNGYGIVKTELQDLVSGCLYTQLVRTKILGFGTNSVVEEVYHSETGIKLARKTIRYSNQGSLNLLVTEVEIMKRLDHPHIVRFVGTYAFRHSFTILMTPSADFDLGYFMENHTGIGEPGIATIIQWFSCLVQGVLHMHSHSVKHQDIKPSNILIRGRNIFLADFGVSKYFIDSESTTFTSGNMTKKYCSPETAHQGLRGRGSDIFSLGCVFIEMLSFLLYDGSEAFREFQKYYFTGDGAFQENLNAIGLWMIQLQAHPRMILKSYLQDVLKFCKSMLKEKSGDRPSAKDLAEFFRPGECCSSSVLISHSAGGQSNSVASHIEAFPGNPPPAVAFYNRNTQSEMFSGSKSLTLPFLSTEFSFSEEVDSRNENAIIAKNRSRFTGRRRFKALQIRKIGACARCRMMRIRCVADGFDPKGVCLSCRHLTNLKISKLPCLRYKITDIKLFKPEQVTGSDLVWTRRWPDLKLVDITLWASSESRIIETTEGYSSIPLKLEVREFVPMDGDVLHRHWRTASGIEKQVLVPPYALCNVAAAKEAYNDYINSGWAEFFRGVLKCKDKLLGQTYSMTINVSDDPDTSAEDRSLLKVVLKLWIAIRIITCSIYICGNDTLGMPPDILGETQPLLGKVPVPPVMSAQINLILIQQIKAQLHAKVLNLLQNAIVANKPSTWFTIYLCIFILLHNFAMLTKYDTGYAREYGLKGRYARPKVVAEYHTDANILLIYWHYHNKRLHPFTSESNLEDIIKRAALKPYQIELVKYTGRYVKVNTSNFASLHQQSDYENDFYFVSQLYEEDWKPRIGAV